MEDWLYNAGLAGLYNILKEAKDNVYVSDNYIEFDSDVLEGLEEKYFNYFIKIYENTMIFSNIINKVKKLIDVGEEQGEFKEYEKDIEYVNSKLNNSSYKSIRKEIPKKALSIKNINQDVLANLLDSLNKGRNGILKNECTGYYDQKSRISKMPHSIIDKYINTNMLDIQKSCDELLNYINGDNSRYELKCFSCGMKIKKIGRGLSFLTNMYFDTSRKTSHVWNFVSDIEICPVCSLVYFCVPAGFTTIFGQGIYINDNTLMKSAININSKIKSEILREHEIKQSLTYRALVSSVKEQFTDNVKYELADIQVVRYKEGRYLFNILSRKVLKVIYDSEENLNDLINCGYIEGDIYFNIYDSIIESLLNNQNLFLLIHKLLVYKISTPDAVRFNTNHVKKILNINFRFMRGLGYMENLDNKIVKRANRDGYFLRKEYKDRKAESKLSGISYRLLNALKVNSKDMFMDTVLNCYLYVQKTVPQVLLDGLTDDAAFKTIGYAFISGLIEGKEVINQDGRNN